VWRAHGLKPHRAKTFKVSRDPKFVEKLEDIVGLHMAPPEHALVLCCSGCARCRRLTVPSPACRSRQGRAETMTHDDKRHGTTTLFAAMSTLEAQ